tara:strand:+ start:270 stop:827 length:558 start_codon:yes stop_codon:yes gene_type:complete
LLVCGCSNRPPEDLSADSISWQEYDNAAEFRLELPDETREWSNEFHWDGFGRIEVHHVMAKSHGLEFQLNFNDFNQPLADEAAQTELERIAIPTDGTLIHDRKTVSRPGCIGIEVVIQRGPNFTAARYYMHESRRLYSLTVTAPWDVRDHTEIVSRFFDSFEVGEKSQVVGAAAVDSESTTNNQI